MAQEFDGGTGAGPAAALAGVRTAARRIGRLRPAQDPCAALATLARPGAVPARVVLVVRCPADAVAAAIAAGTAPADALVRWSGEAARLLAAARALAGRCRLRVERAPPQDDPLAAAIGAAALAGSAEAQRLRAELLAGAPPAPLAAETLAAAARRWHGLAAPVPVPRGTAEGDPALLAARISELEAELHLLEETLADVQEGWRAALADADRLHAATIDVAAHGPAPLGFFDREEGAVRPFRWLGRDPATFETLVPRNRAVRVEVAVEIAIAPGAAESLSLALDGEAPDEHALVRPAAGGARIVALFPAHPFAGVLARARLTLTPGISGRAEGDPRTLSVAVSTIDVRQVADPAPPAAPAVRVAAGTVAPGAPLRVPVRLPAGRPVRVEARAAAADADRLGALSLGVGGVVAANALTVLKEGAAVRTATFLGTGPARLTLELAAGDPLAVEVVLADAAPPAPARAAQTVLSADGAGLGQLAFYDIEYRAGDHLPFRWMGRTEAARIPVDGAAGRTLKVEAHLVYVISEATLAGFVFGIGGRVAETYEVVRGDMIVKSAVLDAGDPAARGWNRPVRLDLLARESVDMSAAGDARTLAVALHKLVVTPL